ncbi:MAG: hypothetical protein ABSA26_07785 [Thermoguttaceae bacterium]
MKSLAVLRCPPRINKLYAYRQVANTPGASSGAKRWIRHSYMKMRRQPNPPGRVFRGNDLMRFMTMVGMLGVLLLLIIRSSDSNTWTWLTNDAGSSDSRSPPAEINNKNNENENKSAPAGKDNEALPRSGGPTDQDREESEAIGEEFQAVTDGGLSIQPEEMPAYNRLLGWVLNQTLSEMRRRAKKEAVFTQFFQSPERYRGQLFELELNVRRILKYTHKELTLYEVWGWTEESRSWLYVGVVQDLPKGMPIGSDVYERATLVGYFFKMQGYMEAGAKPRAAPLQAPLFLGRLIWHRSEIAQTRHSDWSWGLILLAGFVIFLIIRWGLLLRGGRGRLFSPPAAQAKPGGNPVEDWLAKVKTDEQDKAADDNEATNNLQDGL